MKKPTHIVIEITTTLAAASARTRAHLRFGLLLFMDFGLLLFTHFGLLLLADLVLLSFVGFGLLSFVDFGLLSYMAFSLLSFADFGLGLRFNEFPGLRSAEFRGLRSAEFPGLCSTEFPGLRSNEFPGLRSIEFCGLRSVEFRGLWSAVCYMNNDTCHNYYEVSIDLLHNFNCYHVTWHNATHSFCSNPYNDVSLYILHGSSFETILYDVSFLSRKQVTIDADVEVNPGPVTPKYRKTKKRTFNFTIRIKCRTLLLMNQENLKTEHRYLKKEICDQKSGTPCHITTIMIHHLTLHS